MRQGTIVTANSTGAALTLQDAKRQLRIEPEDTEEDDHIQSLCAAAHNKVERDIGYPILRKTLETHLSAFPRGSIWLGGGNDPQIASVVYLDTNDASQTLAADQYRVNTVGRVAEIHRAPSVTWPSTACSIGAVVIEWEAGWTTASEVPADLVHAMKLLVGHWDVNREAVAVGLISSEVQLAYESLIHDFRIPFIA